MKIKSSLSYFLFLTALLSFLSCNSEPEVEPMEINLGLERQNLAIDVVHHYIFHGYDDLYSHINRFEATLETMESVDTANLALLQTRLKDLWLSWQDIAIFQMGPMAKWQLACKFNSFPVDTSLVTANLVQLDTFLNVTTRGLPAIDYLLNNEQALDQLADPQRLDFVKRIVIRMKELLFQVNFENEGFMSAFKSEGRNGTSVISALSLLVTGLDLYLKQFILEAKVAIPAGVQNSDVPRPEATEAYYGGYSLELLNRSLTACHKLFIGDGFGTLTGKSLYHYLVTLEHQDLANTIEAKFEECINKTNQLSDPLSEQMMTNLDKVLALMTSIEELSSLIHNDMVVATNIGLGILEVNCEH